VAWSYVANLPSVPLLVLAGWIPIHAYGTGQSGAPLAEAILDSGGGTVRYEDCYSPGSDFMLGRSSDLVSGTGEETTSNYQYRYRTTLRARGLWTALDAPPADDHADVIVRPAGAADSLATGGREIFRDHRFVAVRRR
jgi:hypothetical protein